MKTFGFFEQIDLNYFYQDIKIVSKFARNHLKEKMKELSIRIRLATTSTKMFKGASKSPQTLFAKI